MPPTLESVLGFFPSHAHTEIRDDVTTNGDGALQRYVTVVCAHLIDSFRNVADTVRANATTVAQEAARLGVPAPLIDQHLARATFRIDELLRQAERAVSGWRQGRIPEPPLFLPNIATRASAEFTDAMAGALA